MKHNRIFQCAHLDFLVSVGDIVNFVRAKEKAKKDWIFTRYVIGSYNEDCQTSNKGQTCQSISRGNTIQFSSQIYEALLPYKSMKN